MALDIKIVNRIERFRNQKSTHNMVSSFEKYFKGKGFEKVTDSYDSRNGTASSLNFGSVWSDGTDTVELDFPTNRDADPSGYHTISIK